MNEVERLQQEVLQVVKDPDKVKKVMSLNEAELRAVTTSFLIPEQGALFDQDKELLAIRIIYYRQLVDWASAGAEKAYQTISEFISSPTFVDYPDFLTNETIMKAVKVEMEQNHALRFSNLSELELEILGARIGESGEVQILMTHNQVHPAYDGISTYMNFSQKEYALPPDVSIGLLKRNAAGPIYGLSNELYVAMSNPYPGSNVKFVEVVLDTPKST